MTAHKRRPIRARALGRSGVSILVATIAGIVFSHWFSPVVAILGGWNAGGLTLLGLTWSLILRCDDAKTHALAGPEDPGRRAVYIVVTFTNTISLLAAIYVQRQAHNLVDGLERSLLVALCLLTVVLSWMVTHTSYTLRHAHLYYREDDEGIGGVEMPGQEKPSLLRLLPISRSRSECVFRVSDMTITRAHEHPANRARTRDAVVRVQHLHSSVYAEPRIFVIWIALGRAEFEADQAAHLATSQKIRNRLRRYGARALEPLDLPIPCRAQLLLVGL